MVKLKTNFNLDNYTITSEVHKDGYFNYEMNGEKLEKWEQVLTINRKDFTIDDKTELQILRQDIKCI